MNDILNTRGLAGAEEALAELDRKTAALLAEFPAGVKVSSTRAKAAIMRAQADALQVAKIFLLLTPRQAAAVLRVSPRTLADWRHRGNCGPPFIRLSARAVRYPKKDLEAWLAERTSKTEPEPVGVLADLPRCQEDLQPGEGCNCGTTSKTEER